MRWGTLACAVGAVAPSLLDVQHSHGGDWRTPTAHEVDGDHSNAGLAPR